MAPLSWVDNLLPKKPADPPTPSKKKKPSGSSGNFSPPPAVRKAAALGLELREKFNRGGTEVGVSRARDLSNGKSLPKETIGRMVSYFARHEVDKKGKDWANRSNPSAGYIAWLLWGGDAGKSWADGIWKKVDK